MCVLDLQVIKRLLGACFKGSEDNAVTQFHTTIPHAKRVSNCRDFPFVYFLPNRIV
jgi:hypothetical protein